MVVNALALEFAHFWFEKDCINKNLCIKIATLGGSFEVQAQAYPTNVFLVACACAVYFSDGIERKEIIFSYQIRTVLQCNRDSIRYNSIYNVLQHDFENWSFGYLDLVYWVR